MSKYTSDIIINYKIPIEQENNEQKQNLIVELDHLTFFHIS